MSLRDLIITYYAHWTGYASNGMKCGESSNPITQKIVTVIYDRFEDIIKEETGMDCYDWKIALMKKVTKILDKYKPNNFHPNAFMIGKQAKTGWPEVEEFLLNTDFIPDV